MRRSGGAAWVTGATGADTSPADLFGAAAEACSTDPWACSAALAARHAAPIHQPRMSDSELPAAARRCAEEARMMSNLPAHRQSRRPATVRNEQHVAGVPEFAARHGIGGDAAGVSRSGLPAAPSALHRLEELRVLLGILHLVEQELD